MALTLTTNIAAQAAEKNLHFNQRQLTKSFARLSSGFRITTAADDAAGLAISESMKSQVRSYAVTERNAADAFSMLQTGEGGLGEIHDILGRMRELSMQASNATYTSSDRERLQDEFSALQTEIGRIQGTTRFNNKSLIDSSAANVDIQVGLANDVADRITLSLGGIGLTSVRSGLSLGGASATAAVSALSTIDSAIATVSRARARFGASMNRMDVAVASIQTMRLNLSAANSRIRDVEIATETSALSRNQVLTQAGISVLAQANELPRLAFGLIG